jgi:hypothetical protein
MLTRANKSTRHAYPQRDQTSAPFAAEAMRGVAAELKLGHARRAASMFAAAYGQDSFPQTAHSLGRITATVGREATASLISAFTHYPCFGCTNGREKCEECGGTGRLADSNVCENCLGLGRAMRLLRRFGLGDAGLRSGRTENPGDRATAPDCGRTLGRPARRAVGGGSRSQPQTSVSSVREAPPRSRPAIGRVGQRLADNGGRPSGTTRAARAASETGAALCLGYARGRNQSSSVAQADGRGCPD